MEGGGSVFGAAPVVKLAEQGVTEFEAVEHVAFVVVVQTKLILQASPTAYRYRNKFIRTHELIN